MAQSETRKTFLDVSFAPVENLQDLVHTDLLDIDLTGNKLKELPDLTTVTKLERICIRQNYVASLENKFPANCPNLDTVDVYDNQLTSTEPLSNFTSITYLDASFNELRKIEPHLSVLTNLNELYLINNKITEIDQQGLSTLSNLKLLELGSNRIREIQHLEPLVNLKKLFLGRNKITEIKGLDTLVNLECLSLQYNRLTEIKGLDCLVNLTELYLSNNGIEHITGLQALVKLQILDLGHNFLTCVENVDHLQELEDFWCQSNKIVSMDEARKLQANTKLTTVYFEHNPLQRHSPNYRAQLLHLLPNLTQIDADFVTANDRARATSLSSATQ